MRHNQGFWEESQSIIILDLLDYSEVVQESGFLFLDFYKAFDAVEHNFILKTLQHFGFSLFIMDAELLSILIQNNGIEVLTVLDRQIIISQFADDTTLFLKN